MVHEYRPEELYCNYCEEDKFTSEFAMKSIPVCTKHKHEHPSRFIYKKIKTKSNCIICNSRATHRVNMCTACYQYVKERTQEENNPVKTIAPPVGINISPDIKAEIYKNSEDYTNSDNEMNAIVEQIKQLREVGVSQTEIFTFMAISEREGLEAGVESLSQSTKRKINYKPTINKDINFNPDEQLPPLSQEELAAIEAQGELPEMDNSSEDNQSNQGHRSVIIQSYYGEKEIAEYKVAKAKAALDNTGQDQSEAEMDNVNIIEMDNPSHSNPEMDNVNESNPVSINSPPSNSPSSIDNITHVQVTNISSADDLYKYFNTVKPTLPPAKPSRRI